MYKVIVVEDNLFMQKHLKDIFSFDGRFSVIGSYRDSREAEQAVRENDVDLVLMDVQTLHNHSGLDSGERIKKIKKDVKVVIVTSLIDPEVLAKAKAGAADSLWYKDHGDADIMDVVIRTMNGENVFPDTSPNVELNNMFSSDISPRQMEILRLFVKGMTYDEIAAKLGISKNGVRWNLDKIVENGGFENKHELLAAVIENKLIVTTLK